MVSRTSIIPSVALIGLAIDAVAVISQAQPRSIAIPLVRAGCRFVIVYCIGSPLRPPPPSRTA